MGLLGVYEASHMPSRGEKTITSGRASFPCSFFAPTKRHLMLLFAQLSAALFVLAPKPEGFDHLALLVVDILRAARASGGSDVHISSSTRRSSCPLRGQSRMTIATATIKACFKKLRCYTSYTHNKHPRRRERERETERPIEDGKERHDEMRK
jgi:hypothetical protein